MKTDIIKNLTLQKFFKIIQNGNKIIFNLEKPSRILLQNIHYSWLKSIHGKTSQQFPVYLEKDAAKQCNKDFYGFINHRSCDKIKEIKLQNENGELCTDSTLCLELNLIVPKTDIMQYFIQWQRYRKYWWSSVTTTPSLFSINDMQHDTESSNVNIMANFSWGQHIVETIKINSNGDNSVGKNINESSCLTCTTGLETAFLTLLLDGHNNKTKEDYLRLHNKMAPYKISFALDTEDPKILSTLKDLSTLLFNKLKSREISAWLPSFSLPLGCQVKENLQLGVTYTAILNENTLSNGIFHLLNSSTMLKEQVHVADFDKYAALLCKK